MSFYDNPSDFFIGGIVRPDLEYVSKVLEGAKKAGYERVVEPCAGQLPISRAAAKAGFKSIEASDVTIFSGILGRYAEGRGIEDMEIVSIRDGELLSDPIEVLYMLKRQQLLEGAGNAYGENVLVDYDLRKDDITKELKRQLDAMRDELQNLTYKDMDMFDHIAEVRDDPKTVVVCNAPGYKGGYEKYYRPLTEAVVWKEPEYDMFDARDGYERLMEYVDDASCLFVLVEDAEAGKPTRKAVYARPAGRVGYNAYVVSNDADEVKRLAGLSVTRSTATLEPPKYPVAPDGYVPNERCVVPLTSKQVSYYRQIIGHTNNGARGYGIVGDGYMLGVFGYMPLANDDVRLSFASGDMREVTDAAKSSQALRMEFSDLEMSRISKFEGWRLDVV